MTESNVPFLRRKAGHKIGRSGRASEKRIAKQLDVRTQPASGAMEGAKGDIVLGNVLIEAKSTINASITIKHSWLSKVNQEALSTGKSPALLVSFVTEDGRPVRCGEWAMIPMWQFREIFGTDD